MMSESAGSLARVENQSSWTALTAAAARAAHLVVDRPPFIFADTLAESLLGDQAEEFLAYHRNHGGHPVLAGARTQTVIRARLTEQLLASHIDEGVDQYLILGAGLDSFAYRSPLAGRVSVFEVDHPATQELKRERLAAAGLGPSGSVAFVPVDFERTSLLDALRTNGFDLTRPAVVSWLGVSMYLTRESVGTTLDELAALAAGTRLVMDYMLPAELRDEAGTTYVDLVAATTAERGEPWLSFFAPQDIAAVLAERGYRTVANLGQREALDADLWQRSDALRPARLSMVVQAALPDLAGDPG
jgi:methyltransferase (TIGR00027 family)